MRPSPARSFVFTSTAILPERNSRRNVLISANLLHNRASPLLRQILPEAPIILFTLHDNKTVEREAFAAGVSALVSKAARMKTLVDQAEDLLRAVQA